MSDPFDWVTEPCTCGDYLSHPDGGDANCPFCGGAMAMRKQWDDLLQLLKDSRDHHEYCGYGDSWERECAGELEKRLDKALEGVE